MKNVKIDTKVMPLRLWEIVQEDYEKEGWTVYGYEPLPVPSIINLRRVQNLENN